MHRRGRASYLKGPGAVVADKVLGYVVGEGVLLSEDHVDLNRWSIVSHHDVNKRGRKRGREQGRGRGVKPWVQRANERKHDTCVVRCWLRLIR